MKYIIGSIIISTGMLIIIIAVLITVLGSPPENTSKYLGWVWAVLTLLSYPLARKLIRA